MANITSMPLANLIVVCFTTAVIIAFVGWLLHRASIIQIGPFTFRKEQEGQTTMYNMNEENANADDFVKLRLRQMTNALRQRIINMFNAYHACPMTRRALSSSLRFPLYESIGNNHFTKELMPDRFDGYRQRVFDSLKDEYIDVSTSSEETTCEKNNLPSWTVARIIVEQFLDMWLVEVSNLVQDCSRQKLSTYTEYLTTYEKNKDTYRTAIVTSCIEKNKRYTEELSRLSERLSRDIRQREKELPEQD